MAHNKHKKDSEYVSVRGVVSTNKCKIGPAPVTISEMKLAKKEHHTNLINLQNNRYTLKNKWRGVTCITHRKEQ